LVNWVKRSFLPGHARIAARDRRPVVRRRAIRRAHTRRRVASRAAGGA
jgi:hypothetical protein